MEVLPPSFVCNYQLSKWKNHNVVVVLSFRSVCNHIQRLKSLPLLPMNHPILHTNEVTPLKLEWNRKQYFSLHFILGSASWGWLTIVQPHIWDMQPHIYGICSHISGICSHISVMCASYMMDKARIMLISAQLRPGYFISIFSDVLTPADSEAILRKY